MANYLGYLINGVQEREVQRIFSYLLVRAIIQSRIIHSWQLMALSGFLQATEMWQRKGPKIHISRYIPQGSKQANIFRNPLLLMAFIIWNIKEQKQKEKKLYSVTFLRHAVATINCTLKIFSQRRNSRTYLGTQYELTQSLVF